MTEPTQFFQPDPQQHAPPGLPFGARIGAWRVLRVIGAGGMGEVYLAERADASFDKQVALKIVQGILTPAAHARFVAEKQALARLEHPHIARLIDAGETEHGWPYLVMEYVDGQQIDHWLAERGVEDVLRVFLQVCDAVAYAHRQLVLHRDLKPSNILVDEHGNARLLDFGVAKLLRSHDTAEESHTVERAYTPEYASPEQVFGRPIGVGSDVYSLGVVLYRLLTGLPPYSFAEGDAGGMVRALSEDTVVAPSRALADRTVSGAARRRARQVSGEIDTIVATALKKKPEQRYATVDAFADDIRRHLAHEPIHARPDSLGYRARKFLRRNAGAVAAAGVAGIALVAGFGVAVWQAHVAQVERARAEQRFEDVRTLAHAVLYKLDEALVKVPGATPARKELVSEMLDYLRRLSAEEDASLPMRLELASAWLRVGDVQGGAAANIGQVQESLASYAQALKVSESVLRATPGDLGAGKLHATILTHLGDAQYQANALDDAERTQRRALGEWIALAGRDPSNLFSVARQQDALGNVMFWTSKLDAAIDFYDQAIATLQRAGPGDDPHDETILRAAIQQDAGYAEIQRDHLPKARELLLRSIATVQPLLKANPGDVPATMLVSNSWLDLGDAQSSLPDHQPMIDAYMHFHDIAAQMAARDPANTIARHQLAMAEMKVGDAQAVAGRYDLALASLGKARDANLAIVAHDPGDQNTRINLADTWEQIAAVEHELGHAGASVAAWREALAIRQSFVEQSPRAATLRRDVAKTEDGFADDQPDTAEACKLRHSADAIWQQLVKEGNARPADGKRIEQAHERAAKCR